MNDSSGNSKNGMNRPYMEFNAEFVRYLNAVRVEEEDLATAIMIAMDAYDAGECYLMTGVITTMQLFVTAPHKARAIIFRLQALAAMIQNNELRNWTQSDGITVVPGAQKALLSVVSDHPLSLIDGNISFERESFLQRILEFAETRESYES